MCCCLHIEPFFLPNGIISGHTQCPSCFISCCCCLDGKLFFLPNDNGSTPKQHPASVLFHRERYAYKFCGLRLGQRKQKYTSYEVRGTAVGKPNAGRTGRTGYESTANTTTKKTITTYGKCETNNSSDSEMRQNTKTTTRVKCKPNNSDSDMRQNTNDTRGTRTC